MKITRYILMIMLLALGSSCGEESSPSVERTDFAFEYDFEDMEELELKDMEGVVCKYLTKSDLISIKLTKNRPEEFIDLYYSAPNKGNIIYVKVDESFLSKHYSGEVIHFDIVSFKKANISKILENPDWLCVIRM